MGLKTGGHMSVNTSHCTYVKSHLPLTLRKRALGLLWLVMMDNNASTRARNGNLLKPTKLYSLKNGLWLLRYAERPTKKMFIQIPTLFILDKQTDGVAKQQQT